MGGSYNKLAGSRLFSGSLGVGWFAFGAYRYHGSARGENGYHAFGRRQPIYGVAKIVVRYEYYDFPLAGHR